MTNLPRAQRMFRPVLAAFRPVLAAGLVAASLALAVSAQAAPIGAYTTKGAWHFYSAANLHPPMLKVLEHKGGLANGDFLVANLPDTGVFGKLVGEGGPLIYDKHLQPVWVLGTGTKLGAANVQQETYEPCGTSACAEPVLAWWEGVVSSQGITTQGQVFVDNEQYRTVAKLTAAKPWVISLHDTSITGKDMWVTEYRVAHKNLKPYGGSKKGAVNDVGLQEYDLTTGKPVGKLWDALNHVPLSASKQKAPSSGVWDAYHLNSVQVLPDGNLLVSMRNTWAVYLINPSTGKMVWTLGGKHSSFEFGKGAKFAWQHDARLVNPSSTGAGTNEELTVFNDNCTYSGGYKCLGGGPSTGLVLRLNTVAHKADQVARYSHQPPVKSDVLGSMQLLPNGNALVGWGSLLLEKGREVAPLFSEYSRSGKQLLDVQWPGKGKDQSYRALYMQAPSSGSCPPGDATCWVGTPYYPPKGAARKASGKTIVYASWNGATQVAKWEVLAGSSSSHLKKVASQSRTGFETAIALKKAYAHYQVEALNAQGKVLKPHSKTFS
jgi:hypothetical protein